LPGGLQESQQLAEPLFTPATKAEIGEHDENIDFDAVVRRLGVDLATRLRDLSLEIYRRAAHTAAQQGIILADTKFEFGLRPDGTLVLADEVLTPDSSRFWDAATWQLGVAPPSYDKQYVRDWLRLQSGWDPAGDQPPPPLPPDVIERTRQMYITAYETLTGKEFT
jgi:phosphoribosylaminoimidazole-succinocarboxamide synthase